LRAIVGLGVGLAVAVNAGSADAAADPCVVRGSDGHMDVVTVHPPGSDPLSPADDPFGVDDVVPEGRWYQVRGSSVQVHARPDARAPSVSLGSGHCDGCIQVREIQRRGAWLLVERVRWSGVVRGWIRRRAVKPLRDGEPHGWGSMCTGDHHWLQRAGHGWAGGPPAGLYEGPATVRAGTPVYADGQQGRWATVVRDTEMKVRFVPGWSSTELIGIPGMIGSYLPAHVSPAAVTLPAAAP
jgi:hypothetical protein